MSARRVHATIPRGAGAARTATAPHRDRPPATMRARRRSTRGATAAALAAVVVAASCGPAEPQLVCGEGAVFADGTCVSRLVEPTCGPGTTLDPSSNECRPDVRCGPGTDYDPAAGACVPTQTCGPGTHVDAATGTCLPDAVCGPGTVYDPDDRTCVPLSTCGPGTHEDPDAGACVPDDRCGEGTTYHPVRRLCVPDLACGPRLVAHDGVCLSPVDVVALDADVVEGLLDANDPAFGGAALALPLAAIGSSTVFAGVVGRPVDLDSDGDEDQDVDAYAFTGAAGQLLRVTVLDDGVGTPAFRVVGPQGWERTSTLGVVHEPARELLLPYDGAYRLEITTASFLRGDGPPAGSPEHGYVGVVEELPWPALRGLDAPALPESASDSGALFSLLDNFFVVRAAADVPVLLAATAAEGTTIPALLVFDADGRFDGEVEFDDGPDGFTALAPAWSLVENGVVVVVDWTLSDGFDAPFTLRASTAPSHDLGAAAASTTLGGPTVVVPGLSAAGWSFAVEEGELVSVHLPGATSPSFVLVSPDGPVLRDDALPGSTTSFFSRAPGAWRIAVVNGATGDATIHPGVVSTTPVAIGALGSADDAPIVAAGDVLSPTRRLAQRAVVVVENTAPLLLAARVDFDLGMPDFDVYRVDDDGLLTDRRRAGEDDVPTVRALRDAPGLTLVVLDPGSIVPPNPAVRGWSIVVTAADPPPFVDAPSDDAGAPLPLDDATPEGPPVHARAFVADDDADRWEFAIEPPLGASELLELHVESLASSSSVPIEVRDAQGALVRDLLSARATAAHLLPQDGAGPFILRVEGATAAGIDYVVSLARRAANVESEPNDDVGAADVFALGAGNRVEVFGTTREGQADFVRVTGAPLPPGSALRARLENAYEQDDLFLTVVDGAGAPIAATEHEDGVLLAAGPPLVVKIEGDSTTRLDHWRLVVDVVAGVEVEPNDDPTNATPLPSPGGLWGQAARFATDVYRVDAAGAATRVTWATALERGDVAVRVLDGDGALVVGATDYAGELAVAVPGASLYFEVIPTGTSTDDRPELYRVTAAPLPGAAESEPNDPPTTTTLLPALVYGQSRVDDVDGFRFAAPGTGLGTLVVVETRVRLAPITVRVRAPDASVVAEATGVDPVLELDPGALAPGALHVVEVVSSVSATGEVGAYALAIEAY